MKPSYFIRTAAAIHISLFLVFGFDCFNCTARSAEKPPSLNMTSAPEYWLDRIDMHWGGRLKTIGSVTFARDDTIFEPVGTGTYLNLDTQYEAILAGGKGREKTQDLRKIFPDFEGSTLFFGAPLNDDGRFMDLTHTIKEDDSYILAQRLDRLNFTSRGDWGYVRIGRQAITWGLA